MWMMLVWLSLAQARASVRKFCRALGSVKISFLVSFTATKRSSMVSHARYTVAMPPEPTLARNSNCLNCIGIMIEWPHFLQGSVANGGRSPGINVLVPHPGQVTILRGLLGSLMLLLKLNLSSIANHTIVKIIPWSGLKTTVATRLNGE